MSACCFLEIVYQYNILEIIVIFFSFQFTSTKGANQHFQVYPTFLLRANKMRDNYKMVAQQFYDMHMKLEITKNHQIVDFYKDKLYCVLRFIYMYIEIF